MVNIDKVEKLREKANVSYEEACDALEECEWDMLDAIIKLEREGKVKNGAADEASEGPAADATNENEEESFQSTDSPQQIVESYQTYQEEKQKKEKRRGFVHWCKKVLKKSIDNKFVVTRHGERVMEMPVLLLVILLLASVWTILILMVVGLFFGFGYSFEGPDLGRKDINDAMAKANDVADDIKNEFHHD